MKNILVGLFLLAFVHTSIGDTAESLLNGNHELVPFCSTSTNQRLPDLEGRLLWAPEFNKVYFCIRSKNRKETLICSLPIDKIRFDDATSIYGPFVRFRWTANYHIHEDNIQGAINNNVIFAVITTPSGMPVPRSVKREIQIEVEDRR